MSIWRICGGGSDWARGQTEYDKATARWYLPKLHYWLAFSLEDTEQEEVGR